DLALVGVSRVDIGVASGRTAVIATFRLRASFADRDVGESLALRFLDVIRDLVHALDDVLRRTLEVSRDGACTLGIALARIARVFGIFGLDRDAGLDVSALARERSHAVLDDDLLRVRVVLGSKIAKLRLTTERIGRVMAEIARVPRLFLMRDRVIFDLLL